MSQAFKTPGHWAAHNNKEQYPLTVQGLKALVKRRRANQIAKASRRANR